MTQTRLFNSCGECLWCWVSPYVGKYQIFNLQYEIEIEMSNHHYPDIM